MLARVGHAEQLRGSDGGRLQPVDPHRLLVARLVAEPDGDEVRGLEHLLRGLGEAWFVAVHRRQGEEARKQHDQRDENEKRDGSDTGQDCVESVFDTVALGHANPSTTTDFELLRTVTLARCRWVFREEGGVEELAPEGNRELIPTAEVSDSHYTWASS